jgi:hypothetical protein
MPNTSFRRDDDIFLRPLGLGVYFAASTDWEPGPKTLLCDGSRLERFMDRLYVPAPFEMLTEAQLTLINRAREDLLKNEDLRQVNRVVKANIAYVVNSYKPHKVVEWGAGFDDIGSLLTNEIDLDLVDIDPQVVRLQRAAGHDCWHPDRDRSQLLRGTYDAAVCVFVLHFNVPRAHIETLARVIAGTGWLLANVYRRSPSSRDELLRSMEIEGFNVERYLDPLALCTEHEYWAASTGRPRKFLRELLARLPNG